jgi:hypothetical protein
LGKTVDIVNFVNFISPVIPAKAGTSGREVPADLPETIEQVRTAPSSLQPCPGDMATCSIFAGVTRRSARQNTAFVPPPII